MGMVLARAASMPTLFFPILFIILGAFADVPTPIQTPGLIVPLGVLAQRAARVAIRVSGLAATDADVDGLATRSRVASLLPEVSVRGTQTQNGVRDYSADTGTVSQSDYGPGFSIQGVVTFHFDKLAYSGQEGRLERLRLERIEARARISQRVIDEVGKWQRAVAEERAEPDGSPARLDAMVRRTNAQMALDVWTGGWFSAFLDGKAR